MDLPLEWCLPKFTILQWLDGSPRSVFRLSLLYMCGLGLCPFSGLVCDLLSRSLRGLSPKAHCRRVSRPIRVTCTTWRKLRWPGAFPTRVGSNHSLGATFFGNEGDLIVGTCYTEDSIRKPHLLATCFCFGRFKIQRKPQYNVEIQLFQSRAPSWAGSPFVAKFLSSLLHIHVDNCFKYFET